MMRYEQNGVIARTVCPPRASAYRSWAKGFPVRHMVGWCVAIGLSGCSGLTGDQPLPAGTSDPSVYATATGAREMRNAAVFEFELALPQAITDMGLITDELADRGTGSSTGVLLQNHGVVNGLDERILVEQISGDHSNNFDGRNTYEQLQSVRQFANQALGALAAYDTAPADLAHARELRGELYAMEGYAEILLGDLFCSGVPLSTLDFDHDYTLRPSSTTADVYHDAIAKFDTALTLGGASDSIAKLARVGRGRAWLNLGQYDSAAAAVHGVPATFSYQVAGAWYGPTTCQGGCAHVLAERGIVTDREGVNGLPYISSGDPRSAVVPIDVQGKTQQFPAKYQSSVPRGSSAFIVVADGIEAQLIRAEAQLQPASAPSGPWLQTLNQLRAAVGLSDTTDPGTAAGRVTLLFSERAYWLFLTGHRQGDLRRLLRQYSAISQFRDQSLVYPIGVYTAPGTGVYGSSVNAAIPYDEFSNPLYHGCLNRAP